MGGRSSKKKQTGARVAQAVTDKEISDAWEAIGALDLRFVEAEVARETNSTVDVAREVVVEYRKFLLLKFVRPELILPPPPLVDAAWHAHVLNTPEYAAMCSGIFGFFVHHSPNMRYVQYSARTVVLYTERFGGPPPSVWPPLPELDPTIEESDEDLMDKEGLRVGDGVDVSDNNGDWRPGLVAECPASRGGTYKVVLDGKAAKTVDAPLWRIRAQLVPGREVLASPDNDGTWTQCTLVELAPGGAVLKTKGGGKKARTLSGVHARHIRTNVRAGHVSCRRCFGAKEADDCIGPGGKCEKCHGTSPGCIISCWGGCG